MSQAKQHLLFDEDAAPWELDEADERLVATIVFATGPAQEFDYAVPDDLRTAAAAGRRMLVPFGRGDRKLVGYCVRLEHRRVSARRLKEVREVIDHETLLSRAMLDLTRWIAAYYLCDWGQVLEAVVPAGVRAQAGTRLTTLLRLADGAAAKLADAKLSKKQRQILDYLAANREPIAPNELANRVGCTVAPISTLRRKGLIASDVRRVRVVEPDESAVAREDDHILNADQQAALDSILTPLRASRHETILIHGVTGSGKTEVYIRAIQEVVSYGRQAIVLVPEISLTPQARERFRARFGNVAVMHSHQSDVERHWHWERIARGEVTVVVGARSAVFAPTPRLGLIVLDEEHEGSFKQDSAPRYHARDVALRRAAAENVPLVLGSATPSLESWYRARRGEYRLVEMPRRVFDRPLPDVVTVDLRNEHRSQAATGAISRQLRKAMEQTLSDGGQVILLLNRRGFSTHVQCVECGEVVRCPHCDIALTHHRKAQLAMCHYCGHEQPPPSQCPACKTLGLRFSGLGTERLEAEVRAMFPDHLALRMDTDTMQRHGSHEKALAAFRDGKVRILLGTQMIAKGLDFPNVTLVGVINADVALHLADFRAAERTFQLLVQVAGRTGRGARGGRVLVQTLSPDHYAIQAAVRHDCDAFAAKELPLRETLRYPPFALMVRVVIRGPRQAETKAVAETLCKRLVAQLAPVTGARVLGPAPAPMARLRGLYRFQLQIQGPLTDALQPAVSAALAGFDPPDEVQTIVDVDPLDML